MSYLNHDENNFFGNKQKIDFRSNSALNTKLLALTGKLPVQPWEANCWQTSNYISLILMTLFKISTTNEVQII